MMLKHKSDCFGSIAGASRVQSMNKSLLCVYVGKIKLSEGAA